MSARLNEQRLAEILARAEAASPGRWESDGAEIYGTLGDVLMIDLWVGETLDIDNQEQSNANAAFIAAARTDVPELVAEVQRLRAQVARLEMTVGTARAMHRKYADSEHCQYDGMEWPCPNVLVLDGAVQS